MKSGKNEINISKLHFPLSVDHFGNWESIFEAVKGCKWQFFVQFFYDTGNLPTDISVLDQLCREKISKPHLIERSKYPSIGLAYGTLNSLFFKQKLPFRFVHTERMLGKPYAGKIHLVRIFREKRARVRRKPPTGAVASKIRQSAFR